MLDGATHFLTKRLPKVATEMALNVLAYNMKRVMAIVGVGGLLEAIARVRSGFARPNQRLQKLRVARRLIPLKSENSAAAKCAVATRGPSLPRDFHTAWAISGHVSPAISSTEDFRN